MRHLTVSTALLAGCLIAGGAWAQGSPGGSGGGTGGAAGGSSTSATPSTGSTASPSSASQPSGSTLRRPAQGMRGSADPGNRSSRVGGSTGNTPAGNSTTSGPIPPPGTEGSTGPAATGTVAGDNRLQPGERSSVGPSLREEKLLEEADKRVRRGICQGC
jgi:hypothetical protein